MRVRILGKLWRLMFSPNLKEHGYCDAPTLKNKTIRVSSKLRGRKRLEIILHECLHAADWTKDETWVDETAKDLARILDRLGYHDGEES
jgi:hypothetical protein